MIPTDRIPVFLHITNISHLPLLSRLLTDLGNNLAVTAKPYILRSKRNCRKLNTETLYLPVQ
jgi:hypothetical protein